MFFDPEDQKLCRNQDKPYFRAPEELNLSVDPVIKVQTKSLPKSTL